MKLPTLSIGNIQKINPIELDGNGLSISDVIEMFYYSDGVLYWRHNHVRVKSGDKAGYIRSDGYGIVGIRGHNYRIHILVWVIHNRLWPIMDIDHIDNNPSNNHIENLRLATKNENHYNMKLNSNNTTGHKGISWCKKTNSWFAKISTNGKVLRLGRFKNIENAINIISTTREKLHGKFANHG